MAIYFSINMPKQSVEKGKSFTNGAKNWLSVRMEERKRTYISTSYCAQKLI